MLLPERFLEISHHLLIDRTVRHRHSQLVRLPLIVERGGTAQAARAPLIAFGRELLHRLPSERCPGALDLAEIALAQQAPKCPAVVMLDIGVQQAE